jgi:hypothetical protein
MPACGSGGAAVEVEDAGVRQQRCRRGGRWPAATTALAWRSRACGRGGLLPPAVEVSCLRRRRQRCGGLVRAAAIEDSYGCSSRRGNLLGRDP